LKSAGCEPEVVGRPQRIGDAMACAALFEPIPDRLEAFRAELRMGDSVLAPGAKEPAFT